MTDANPTAAPAVTVTTGTDAKLTPKAIEPSVTKLDTAGTELAAPKKWTLNFGQEKEEVDEETLLKYAQKARGADKTFQSAAAQRAEVENIVELLKNDPAKAVLNKALGHNPKSILGGIIKQAIEDGYDMKDIKDFVADQMYEWIQEDNLDPKEKENRSLKKQLEKIEAEKKYLSEQQRQEQMSKLTEEAKTKFDSDITETLKTSGLPKTSFTVKRMAYYLDQAYKVKQEYAEQGVEIRDPKCSDILSFVRKEYDDAIRELYGQADVETLTKLLGEDKLKDIRKYDIEKLKQGSPQTKQTPKTENPIKKEKSAPPAKKGNFLKQREEEIRQMERGA